MSLITISQAQLFSWQYPSPAVSAVGGASTALVRNHWAGFYNPAGLSAMEQKEVGFSYFNLYNLSFLRTIFVTAAIPFDQKIGTFSVSYGNFGVDYQNENLNSETVVMLSYGRYLFKDFNSSLAIGFNVKMLRWDPGTSLQFGDLGTANAFAMDFGFQASLYQRTYFGAYLTNINNPTFGAANSYELPKRLIVGFGYIPYSGVKTTFDINKDFESQLTQYWGGIEVEVNKYFVLRTGARMNPSQFTFGFGIRAKGFVVDYALITHPELSETHQFGFSYSW
jgi:hypothetical protein